MGTEQPWTIVAQNLPEHAGNPIHTDAGAQAAGFPRALVAGVTVYAYLTRPVVDRWDFDWVGAGGGEVRFHSPVFDGDSLALPIEPDPDDREHAAIVTVSRGGEGSALATLWAVERADRVDGLRPGEVLQPVTIELSGQFGAEYGTRAGDDDQRYLERGAVHPAVWPAMANAVTHRQVARGPWVHTRSLVRHHGVAEVGRLATVRAVVVDRFERPTGERAVLDVVIEVDGRVVATLEHEAIVALPGR